MARKAAPVKVKKKGGKKKVTAAQAKFFGKKGGK